VSVRLSLLSLLAAGLIAGCGSDDPPKLNVTIHNATISAPVRPGFIGLSLEYEALPAYAGTNPKAINPVFEQLVRNINPRQAAQLRIGGDSTDATWWPVPGMRRPGGVTYELNNDWARVARALGTALRAKLLLGINLELKDHSIAGYEARALVSRIGTRSISALELGNEPELYGVFGLYKSHGRAVRLRPRGYDIADYTREFNHVSSLLPHVPLAGPATGAPIWEARLRGFLAAVPNLSLLTLHRYATRGCYTSPRSPNYHTISNLLSSRATAGLAAIVAPFVHLEPTGNPPVRLDEINSVNCGGVRGVSDTFATALWSLDTLFQLARVGVAGVNFHTFDHAAYAPFSFSRANGTWTGRVNPVYYGMLAFARTVPPGSQLLAGSGRAASDFDVFAIRTPQHQVRAVLVNYSQTQDQTAELHLPASGPATVERLVAPSVRAKLGVQLGGRTFGAQTTTGKLAGRPTLSQVKPGKNGYMVQVPAGSAAVVSPSGTA
jgi:Glycosyl hydrolase family 79 C-terminal beta domain